VPRAAGAEAAAKPAPKVIDKELLLTVLGTSASQFASFILRLPADSPRWVLKRDDPLVESSIADRLQALLGAIEQIMRAVPDTRDELQEFAEKLVSKIPKIRAGDVAIADDPQFVNEVMATLPNVLFYWFKTPEKKTFRKEECSYFRTLVVQFFRDLY